jgi:hypothetical protein
MAARQTPIERAEAAAQGLVEHEDRIAWILGSSRSGSTWLLRMLTDLEGVVGIDDPHLGHHLGVWRPMSLAWATADEPPRLQTLLEVKRHKPDYFFSDRYRSVWLPALRDLIARRFGATLAERGGPESTLVVKEPGSHVADLLFDAFPGSRLIFLLRDGRDVVDSWLDAYQQGSWAIDGGAYAVADGGRLALIEWLASVWSFRTRTVAEVFDRVPESHRVLVRYEHLLADPVGGLRRVCETLGLEMPKRRIEKVTAQHAIANIDAKRRGRLQEVRKAAPGGWRENLSRDEQRAMQAIMAAELDRFGYRDAGSRAVAA